MTKASYDIFISGGGVAGLCAAVAFGHAGAQVLCVDPVPPVTNHAQDGADLRTTAYLQPAQAFLDRIGLWDKVTPHAADLGTMRIVDAGGADIKTKDFNSTDISNAPFGWNVGNWQMRAALLERLGELPNVTFRPGVSTTDYMTRTDGARIKLSDGSRVEAQMGIAADGRGSFIRSAMGIPTKQRDFGQQALAFAVTHTQPHGNTSTEVHRSGGPFTLVPLPDFEGMPCSAVVWMERTGTIRTLQAMQDAEFNTAATERSAHVMGPLTAISRRTAWPIISQLATSFYAERTALVAEAAHVVPPIGAQGLNMSLRDIETLLDLCVAAPNRVGHADLLRQYHKARFGEVSMRIAGISLLNQTSMAGRGPIPQARAWGLQTLHGVKPIRTALMRLGLGAS